MYPTCITVHLDENQSGYAHSKYYLSPQSIYVKDRFSNLVLSRSVRMAEDAYYAQCIAQGA